MVRDRALRLATGAVLGLLLGLGGGAASAQERARDMTEQLNARFAAWIRQNPGDWLCTKRRFPKAKRRGAKKATSSPSAGEGNA